VCDRRMVRIGAKTYSNLYELRAGCGRSCGTVPPVLGQAHTPRRRLLPFAAFALVVLAAPTLGLAGSSTSASTLRAQNLQLETNRRAAVLQLYSLEERLAQARARIESLNRKAESLRAERASLSHQLGIAKASSRIAQRQLARRLRMLYEQGNVEPLEIVFGAKNLDEALSSLDSLSRVTGQSEDVLRQLETARVRLAAASSRLAARRQALLGATREAQTQAASLVRTRAARTSYISSLAAERRLNESQISSLVAAAQAARARTEDLTPPAAALPAATLASASEPAAAPAPGGRELTVNATGYSLSGRTATGLPTGWGVAAVDPAVIPLGTHMTIPGYGEAVAADIGGSISGTTIDLWFPSPARANAWGRRTVTAILH
jgi:3D (Asp-Asp-Asp) domain-containing protein